MRDWTEGMTRASPMPLMAQRGRAAATEFVRAKRMVKIDQMRQPRKMMWLRGRRWVAMPARGEARACMKDLARVMFPSWVGVAPKDAPTRE